MSDPLEELKKQLEAAQGRILDLESEHARLKREPTTSDKERESMTKKIEELETSLFDARDKADKLQQKIWDGKERRKKDQRGNERRRVHGAPEKRHGEGFGGPFE